MNQPSTSAGIGTSAADRVLAARAVEHAVEQLDVLLLGVEEMIDFEPAEILVLQPGERLEEDHRAAVAIAVEQGEAAVRLARAATVLISDMTGVIPDPPAMPTRWRDLRRVEIGREAAVRRHDVDRVAGLQTGRRPSWKRAPPPIRLTVTIQSRLVGRGAERIIAAHFLAVDGRAQGQMLAGLEREFVAKLGRNLEADRIGLGGLGHDLRDPQARGNARPSYQVASG